MIFPCVPKPFPDELLYSYISRVALESGLTPEMAIRIYSGRKTELPMRPNSLYYSQVEKKLYPVLHPVLKADGGNTSFVHFLFSHSLTPTMTTFMNGEDKAEFIGQVNLSPYRAKLQQYRMDRKLRSKDTGILNVCPECLKEDRSKYGIFYYHRSHQFPYITICYKHGCSLMTYSGPVGNELTSDMFDVVATNTIPDAKNYAIFCYKLLQKPLPLYRSNFLDEFSTMDIEKPVRELSSIFNVSIFNRGKRAPLKFTSVSNFLVLMFLVFGTAEEYWKRFQKIGDATGKLMDEKAMESGYVQISPRVGAIMELRKREETQLQTAVNTTSFICDGIIFIPHTI